MSDNNKYRLEFWGSQILVGRLVYSMIGSGVFSLVLFMLHLLPTATVFSQTGWLLVAEVLGLWIVFAFVMWLTVIASEDTSRKVISDD